MSTNLTVTYRFDLSDVDWAEMKAGVQADDFDNGRSPEQLRQSFHSSYAACVAYADGQIVGTARVLSDGVCNAYLVDVWTRHPYRRQGIASGMVQRLLERLPGQHVALFTDSAAGLYARLGFQELRTGMARVVGQWLVNH
jgi:predicted GNAT family acetyltransferase